METKKAELDVADKKSFLERRLGTFEASKIPLYNFLIGFSILSIYTFSWPRDHRTYPYPFLGNRFTCVIVTSLYIISSLTWGPKLMENRPAVQPRRLRMAYNLFQVFFCSYVCFEAAMSGWLTDFSWKCQPEDTSSSQKALRLVRACYLYYISKIIDFTDTVFLVLAKKWTSVSTFHIIHHSFVYMCAWQGLYYTPGGHLTMTPFINSGVHMLIHAQHFLSAFGEAAKPYLWWKKYLNTIQIAHFIIIFVHSTQVLFRDCPVPKVYAIFICVYTIGFTIYSLANYLRTSRNKKVV